MNKKIKELMERYGVGGIKQKKNINLNNNNNANNNKIL